MKEEKQKKSINPISKNIFQLKAWTYPHKQNPEQHKKATAIQGTTWQNDIDLEKIQYYKCLHLPKLYVVGLKYCSGGGQVNGRPLLRLRSCTTASRRTCEDTICTTGSRDQTARYGQFCRDSPVLTITHKRSEMQSHSKSSNNNNNPH